jgi:hypothetical protein
VIAEATLGGHPGEVLHRGQRAAPWADQQAEVVAGDRNLELAVGRRRQLRRAGETEGVDQAFDEGDRGGADGRRIDRRILGGLAVLAAAVVIAARAARAVGQINNAERITTRIAVRVVDTLPNGNLLIEGRRQTKISGETTDAILRGTVRTEDITAQNTIFSYNIADASIHYLSKGVVSDSQRKGWFLRIWDKVTPF